MSRGEWGNDGWVKPTAGLAALALVATTVVAGCGDETGSSSPSSTPTTGLSATPTPAPTPVQAFPLTVSRTGGFAGFDDKLVIQADGSATLTRRAQASTTCRVDQTLLASIAASATKVDWSALPGKPPKVEHPDDMVVAVSAGGGVAELGDPRVGALNAPLSRLLADTGNPAGQRKLCR